MTPRRDVDSRILELRGQIMTDLTILRQKWDRRTPWPRPRGEARSAEAAWLHGVPTWAIGVAAGLLAGVWSALRRPKSAR